MAILPKSLFWRFLLIIIIPIICIQIITAYIFYHRHWEKVNQHMENALLSEIYILTNFIKNAKTEEQTKLIISGWSDLFNLKISNNNKKPSSEFLEEFNKSLSNKLKKSTSSYYLEDLRTIRCEIEMNDKILTIDFSNKRLHSSTTYIFILWILGTSILLAIISLIFMKNQLRSIISLAHAAEKFGRGHTVDNFSPSGAREIRIAGFAFIRMKKNVEKQIKYRTDLLTHISHDLGTPITRMKLQLELMKDSEEKSSLKKNLNEIKEMTTHYLNFAKGEGNEELKKVNFTNILEEIVHNFNDRRIELIFKEHNIILSIKFNALKRAISNVINNAIKFGEDKILITLKNTQEEVFITIEDDGSGIPDQHFKEVIQPFFQLNKDKEGFGLGLAITKTIINAHGGYLTLSKSSLGGLKVSFSLPH